MTGREIKNSPKITALGVNMRSKNPNGARWERRVYPNKPVRTVGKAMEVFKIIRSNDLPRNEFDAMTKPVGTPTAVAKKVAVTANRTEQLTILYISLSKEKSKPHALYRPSKRKSIVSFGK